MRTLCAALLVFVLLLVPVYSEANDAIQEQINKNSAQIAELQKEIAKLQTELNATSQQKQTLQSTVASYNLNIQKTTKSISLTNTQISQKDTEIGRLSGSISTTANNIDGVKGQIANSLRQLDMLEQEPMAVMLLGGGTLSSFFDEATALAALRLGLQDRVVALSDLKTDLTVSKDVAEDKRDELARLQQKLAQEKQSLAVARDEQNKLLQQTKNKESNYQALIAQKQAEQAAFERVLFELASQLKSADATNIPQAGSGVLRWPLDAPFITQQFGKTIDAGRLYTSGTHDGIDMRASVGTPVRAALSGTVFEVNQGAVAACQYGKWVIVKHANGLATLYAHLSTINVQKGQTVTTGQVVGLAGNTGYATGPHLHFTVYLAEALSLKQYTCKSGYTVTVPIAPLNAYLNPVSYLTRL